MFTLIAYKPDSSDYCRGCHMASYSSDHKVHVGLNADDLAAKIAEYGAFELDYNEAGYSITVLASVKDRIVVVYDESGETDINQFPLLDDPDYQAVESVFETVKQDEELRRAAIIKARKEAKEQAEQAAQEVKRQRQAAAEKAEFERLKAKFGQGKVI